MTDPGTHQRFKRRSADAAKETASRIEGALAKSEQGVEISTEVASTLNEIARSSRVGITLDERAIPVNPEVQAACDLLGMDPIYVANEGKLIAIVAREKAPGGAQE